MGNRFPEVRKTISSYISEENGRITKHSLLSLGAILASAAFDSSKLREASAQTLHDHSHLSHSSHSSY